MTMRKKIEFICERRLIEDSLKQKAITVRIGKPQKVQDSKYPEYVCAFQLSGLGRSHLQYAHGIDEFQALFLALEGIRTTIEKSGKSYSWNGGEKGDHGFTRYIPTYFGLRFIKHIDKLIDREIERSGEKAKRKHIKLPG